jgi:hypothetical protein
MNTNPTLLDPIQQGCCETCCRVKLNPNGEYECRAHFPPALVVEGDAGEASKCVAVWPMVRPDDWCGWYSDQNWGR